MKDDIEKLIHEFDEQLKEFDQPDAILPKSLKLIKDALILLLKEEVAEKL